MGGWGTRGNRYSYLGKRSLSAGKDANAVRAFAGGDGCAAAAARLSAAETRELEEVLSATVGPSLRIATSSERLRFIASCLLQAPSLNEPTAGLFDRMSTVQNVSPSPTETEQTSGRQHAFKVADGCSPPLAPPRRSEQTRARARCSSLQAACCAKLRMPALPRCFHERPRRFTGLPTSLAARESHCQGAGRHPLQMRMAAVAAAAPALAPAAHRSASNEAGHDHANGKGRKAIDPATAVGPATPAAAVVASPEGEMGGDKNDVLPPSLLLPPSHTCRRPGTVHRGASAWRAPLRRVPLHRNAGRWRRPSPAPRPRLRPSQSRVDRLVSSSCPRESLEAAERR